MKWESKFMSRTFVLAGGLAVLFGGLSALLSLTAKRSSLEYQRQHRAERIEQIRQQLVLAEEELEALHVEMFKAQTALTTDRLGHREAPLLHTDFGEERAPHHPEYPRDFSIAARHSCLVKEMEQLQEQESWEAGLPAWILRQSILIGLAVGCLGFGGWLAAVWFWRLGAVNRKQKLVVLAALAVVTVTILYPPWVFITEPGNARDWPMRKDAGHSFLWRAPCEWPYLRSASLDLQRLCLQWLLVVSFGGGLVAAFANNDRRKMESGYAAGAAN